MARVGRWLGATITGNGRDDDTRMLLWSAFISHTTAAQILIAAASRDDWQRFRHEPTRRFSVPERKRLGLV
jgi:hypothetical protein